MLTIYFIISFNVKMTNIKDKLRIDLIKFCIIIKFTMLQNLTHKK